MFKRFTREIFEETQQVDDFVSLVALEWSDGVSAVAEHHRGVAIRRKRIELGVPPHRTVKVSVGVDNAWSNVGTAGIEQSFTIGDEAWTDLGDYTVSNTNIGFVRGRTSSVDDCSACD